MATLPWEILEVVWWNMKLSGKHKSGSYYSIKKSDMKNHLVIYRKKWIVMMWNESIKNRLKKKKRKKNIKNLEM